MRKGGNKRREKKERSKDEIDFNGLLDAIIDDDVEKFQIIMNHAPNPDIYFSASKYELPKITATLPPVLSMCAFFGSKKCTDAIIKMRPKFDKVDKFGRTPAHFAAAGGDLEIISKLVDKKCSFSSPDALGDCPITYAAMFNRLPAVKVIYEMCHNKGEEIDLVQPLATSSRFGHIDIVKFFVEELNIPVKDNDVINSGCANGDINVIKYLIDHGADVNKPDKSGVFPIIDAINSGKIDAVKLLVHHGADYVLENNAYTPLIEATAIGYLDIIKYLVNLGVSLSITNKHGVTALQAALETKNMIISKYLIKAGAPINQISNVLELAAQFGDFEFLKLVFDKIEDKEGQLKSKKLLTIVLNSGNIESLRFLLDAGMELSVQDIIFYNMIELAIKNESPELLSFVIERGADVEKSKVPFKYALKCIKDNGNVISNNMLQCLKILIEAGVNIFGGASKTEFFYRLFDLQSPDVYMLILNNKQDFDLRKFIAMNLKTTWKNICGYEKGKPSILFDFFLDNLLDVNATDNDGFSILNDVIKNAKGNELIYRLLEKGVKVNTKPKSSPTPLLACIYQKKYSAGCILLEHGADPNVRGVLNELPLEIAAKTDDALFLSAMLIKQGSEFGESLNAAIENKSYKTAALLILNGADFSSLEHAKEVQKVIKRKGNINDIISAIKGERKSLTQRFFDSMKFC